MNYLWHKNTIKISTKLQWNRFFSECLSERKIFWEFLQQNFMFIHWKSTFFAHRWLCHKFFHTPFEPDTGILYEFYEILRLTISFSHFFSTKPRRCWRNICEEIRSMLAPNVPFYVISCNWKYPQYCFHRMKTFTLSINKILLL